MSVCIKGDDWFLKQLRTRLGMDGVQLEDDPEEADVFVLDRKSGIRQASNFALEYSIVESLFPSLDVQASGESDVDFWVIKRYDPEKGFTQQTFVFLQSKGLVQEDRKSSTIVGGAGRFVDSERLHDLFTMPLALYLQSLHFKGPVALGMSLADQGVVSIRLDFPLLSGQLLVGAAAEHKEAFLQDCTDFRLYESWTMCSVVHQEPWPWNDKGREISLVFHRSALGRLWPCVEMDYDLLKTNKTQLAVATSFGGSVREADYHLKRSLEWVVGQGVSYRLASEFYGEQWTRIVDQVL